MKNVFKFSFLAVIFIIIYGCNEEANLTQDDITLIPIYEDGKIVAYGDISSFRLVTSVEIQSFIEKGWMSELEARAHNCEWSDGHGGALNCDGGECEVVEHIYPDGSTSVGIGCFINGRVSHTGLYR